MPKNDFKTVLITGASSGLGEGLVERFVRDGHTVIATARRGVLLEALASRLNAECSGRCIPRVCDVQFEEEVSAVVAWAESEIGPLDVVIANAGISESTSAEHVQTALMERVLKTNILGVMYTFNAVIPYMVKRGAGHLVCMSSLAAYRGLPGAGAYCASKAAVSALTESYRLDLKRFGIDVTVLQPGWIQTPLTDRNAYSMPLRMSRHAGVDRLYRAIVCRRAVASFPWLLAMGVRLLWLLPACFYDAVMANRRNMKSGFHFE